MSRPRRPNSYPAVMKLVHLNNNRLPDEFSGEVKYQPAPFKMMKVLAILRNELYILSSRPILLAMLLSLMNLAGFHNQTVIMFLETMMFIQLAFDNFEQARGLSLNSCLIRLAFDMTLYLTTSATGHFVIQYFKITENEFKFVNTGQIWDGLTELFYAVAGKNIEIEQKGWFESYFAIFHVHSVPKETSPWILGMVTAIVPYLHMLNVITVFRIVTLSIELLCRSGEAYFAAPGSPKPKPRKERRQSSLIV